MKSIVVFCGSGEGFQDIYRETAFALGLILAEKNIRLVYGGAKIGLMGAVAAGVLEKSGRVTGVIPEFLEIKEVAHEGLSEMIRTRTMHERKMKMHELSDGIIALPGGWGTMEELFEMMTWAQLGLHSKPIGLLNIHGFYEPFLAQMDLMVEEGFLKEAYKKMILVSEDIEHLLQQMENYQPPALPKWLNLKAT